MSYLCYTVHFVCDSPNCGCVLILLPVLKSYSVRNVYRFSVLTNIGTQPVSYET